MSDAHIQNGVCVCVESRSVTARLLLSAALRDMFGEESVDFSDEKNISVTVDGKTILVCLETRVRREASYVVVELCFFTFYVVFSSAHPPPISQSATRTNAQRTIPSEKWWIWQCSGFTMPLTRSSERRREARRRTLRNTRSHEGKPQYLVPDNMILRAP